MTRTTDEFLRAFEEIKSEVNRRAGTPKSERFDIEAAADRDPAVRGARGLLVSVRELRNFLQHPRHKSEGHAFHIAEPFLAEVQGLLMRLKNPPTARSVAVPRKKIRTARPEERLGDLAADMRLNGFSHLPILNEKDVVIGVFNEAAVFHHLWAEAETIIGRDMPIAEILPCCRLDADHTETFQFVKPNHPLDALIDTFRALETPRKRVGAAFVTSSGRRTEPLLGLITPWDVLATKKK